MPPPPLRLGETPGCAQCQFSGWLWDLVLKNHGHGVLVSPPGGPPQLQVLYLRQPCSSSDLEGQVLRRTVGRLARVQGGVAGGRHQGSSGERKTGKGAQAKANEAAAAAARQQQQQQQQLKR